MTSSAARSEDGEQVVVRPATLERFDDVVSVINRACSCQYWRMSAAEHGPATYGVSPEKRDIRREALRDQCRSEPVPGVVAYLEGAPVGWCSFGPRSSMRRLEESRTIPRLDDQPVWSVVCFTIKPRYRGRGLAKVLLAAAIDYAREQGAVGMEAYAIDTRKALDGAAMSYLGSTRLFEAAGFRRVVKTSSMENRLPRWLMRLDLLNAGH